jgi:4-amino-4-deoxy-L-arabinose transferase-like glycosyltransferase
MNYFQDILQGVEVGKGQILVRLVPLITAIVIIAFTCDLMIYRGLDDAQSMDNAQLSRQIARGQGFTTEFLRPHAIAQMRDFAINESLQTGKPRDLFPPDRFPPGTPRILPDTYNPPGYAYLLATWFRLTHPEWDQPPMAMSTSHIYSGDRLIPVLNQIFLILTAILVFVLGHRLFDGRVAWMSLVAFLATDLIWRYSLTALPTLVLMFFVTAMLLCTLEIFCIGEDCFESEERSFTPAWYWAIAVGLLLAAACLTRLHVLVLLLPLFIFLILMPRSNFFIFIVIALITFAFVTPWFVHVNNVCGNPLGSNTPLLLYGEDDYKGNQIFCTTSLPTYERLFKDASKKEYSGFRWHFEHAWNLLGSNPLILLFGASILHQFKRRRTKLFHWLVFACAFALIAANNLGDAAPETLGPWNTVIILFPAMLVIGGAFFFILLDRLMLQLWLLNNLVVTATLILTVMPLVLTLTSSNPLYYNFPPYMPPVIKSFAQFSNPDEWVTTDMPWATAWYGDRASLWMPDSLTDFENLHDNVCPTGLLLLTPATWDEPYSNISTGEYKDWYSVIVGPTAPANFPLSLHTQTGPGGPDYSLWSDRPRWQAK